MDWKCTWVSPNFPRDVEYEVEFPAKLRHFPGQVVHEKIKLIKEILRGRFVACIEENLRF